MKKQANEPTPSKNDLIEYNDRLLEWNDCLTNELKAQDEVIRELKTRDKVIIKLMKNAEKILGLDKIINEGMPANLVYAGIIANQKELLKKLIALTVEKSGYIQKSLFVDLRDRKPHAMN